MGTVTRGEIMLQILAAAVVVAGLCAMQACNREDAYSECEKEAIKSGNVTTQLKLGLQYDSEEKWREAFKWFKRAAKQGDALAQTYVGACYNYGRGARFSHKKALKWYGMAAVQGESSAQTSIGQSFVYCQKAKQDLKEAVKWYTQAAEQGNQRAAYELAYSYMYGFGIEQDYSKVFYWSCKTVEGDHSTVPRDGVAMILGCYMYGIGVEQNEDMAAYWRLQSVNFFEEDYMVFLELRVKLKARLFSPAP